MTTPETRVTLALLGAYSAEVPSVSDDIHRLMARVAIGMDSEAATKAAASATAHLPMDNFAGWLKALDPDHSAVGRRIELQAAYPRYGNGFGSWRRLLRGRQPEYTGAESRAHIVHANGVEPAILKRSRNKLNAYGQILFVEARTKPLLAASGIEGYEQPMCLDYEAGVSGSSPIPGKSLLDMKAAELKEITSTHLRAAFDTARQLDERGIMLDFTGDNVHFDSTAGFGFFDALGILPPDVSTRQNVHLLPTIFNAAGRAAQQNGNQTQRSQLMTVRGSLQAESRALASEFLD